MPEWVLGVVPSEEVLTEGACIGQAAETRREFGAVLHCLELGFTERVVIGDVGPAPLRKAGVG